MPVEKTLTPVNNTDTSTGIAEEHEFDNPLYADSASLSLDLEGQGSPEEAVYAAPGSCKGREISDNINQNLNINESSSENQTDGE